MAEDSNKMSQSTSTTTSNTDGSSQPSCQPVTKSKTDLVPGLLYYEFLPLVRRSKATGLLEFQDFEDVVERASEWYRVLVGYRVVSMETVQFKFKDRDSSSFSEPALSSASREDRSKSSSTQKHYYGDGVRIWIFPSKEHMNGGFELGYRDFEPQLLQPAAGGDAHYEAVSDLLERFNKEQASGAHPIPGKLVSVESRELRPTGKARQQHVSPSDGFGYYHVFSLRFFFYRGLPTRERIQIRDIVPKPYDEYTFEQFTGVLKRASQWLESESPVKLYNLQTLFVKAKLDVPPGTALYRKVRVLVRYLKVMRIVYSTFPECAADFKELRPPRCLTHRVFMPTLRRAGDEVPVVTAIREIKASMGRWSAGLRGNILCAESLTVDYHIPTGRGPSKIDASAPSKSETEAGAMGEHPQRQQRTRVVLYFRVYTDCPEDTQPRVSRPQLHVGNSSQAGSEKRRCRIM